MTQDLIDKLMSAALPKQKSLESDCYYNDHEQINL